MVLTELEIEGWTGAAVLAAKSGGGAPAARSAQGMKESAPGLRDGAGCSWRRDEAAALLRWGYGAAELCGRGGAGSSAPL